MLGNLRTASLYTWKTVDVRTAQSTILLVNLGSRWGQKTGRRRRRITVISLKVNNRVGVKEGRERGR